jgi:hypothetical protein
MTLSLRAVAVLAAPLLTFGCASFAEEPAPSTEEPVPAAIPHTGGTPVDNKTPAFNQTKCSAGDTWSELSLGVNEQGVATRVVMKFGGRDGTSLWTGELVAEVGVITALGEAEVRIDVAQTIVPVRYERTIGGSTTRPAETLDVRAITLGRQGDSAIVRLETPSGRGFVTSCGAQEAVEVGGVARKLIALQP